MPERSYPMKKILFSLLSITFVMLLPFRAVASWYEVTGVATIVSSEDAARLHALEDALFKAVN
ncbi:flagellar assembly protein T N-terminal domain-containing protein, partial [Vibrio parahaemolyticus]|nr:flagellar assembly protein T N-terminal domain-containing protein [Vibrio parahaemolyticus]